MTTNEFTPGRYVLIQEVAVPRPDRRCKYDWRRLQTVSVGSKFLVEDHNEGDYTFKRLRPEGIYGDKLYFSTLNRSESEDHDGHAALLRAMLPHLKPMPWDAFSTLDFRLNKEWYSPLLDTLLEMGKITLNDIAEACTKLESSYSE